ncbi:MAG: UbiD family decarboxylase [Nitrososphaerales archaeon]
MDKNTNSPDLRHLLEILEINNQLIRIKKEVSYLYEVAAIMKKLDKGPVLFFEKIKDSNYPLVSGLCSTKERICSAIGINSNEFNEKILSAITNPINPKIIEDAPFKECSEKPKLSNLPIIKHYEKDAGRYITAGVVFTKNIETKTQNASIHRLLLLDDEHLVIRVVEGRHLWRCLQLSKREKKPLEVAIAIGVHPAISLAAACQVPYGVDEMGIANYLLNNNLTLAKCNSVNLFVPSYSEIVLEGEFMMEREELEFMADMLGTYDYPRKQPVIRIKNISHRKNPIYQGLLPAGSEHRLLMSLPVEVKLFQGVKNTVPSTKVVHLTDGGCNWLHAVIQIKKTHEGEPKNAIISAFANHPSLKLAIVVDDDINPFDMRSVEFAIATRFQGDKDLIVIPNVKGSSLDPSSDQDNLLTTKVGIDATISLFKKKEKFDIAKIPGEDLIDVKKYIT